MWFKDRVLSNMHKTLNSVHRQTDRQRQSREKRRECAWDWKYFGFPSLVFQAGGLRIFRL